MSSRPPIAVIDQLLASRSPQTAKYYIAAMRSMGYDESALAYCEAYYHVCTEQKKTIAKQRTQRSKAIADT